MCDKEIKMKQIFLLFVGIVFCYNAFSDTLKGKVIDSTTGESLSGAVVQIVATNLYCVTNSKGNYQIEYSRLKKVELKCSFLGYNTFLKNIELTPNVTICDIKLKASNFDLNSVVITASRSERKLKDVPQITQVVSSKEIEKVGAVDLKEALEMAVPGLEFRQEGWGTNLKMQGLDGKYVLVLIDGERMAGETRGNIDYSRLNAANVERIEVVRGAASSLYGSRAIAGVINIITKENKSSKLDITSHARYSRFNELSTGLTAGFRKNQVTSQTDLQYKRSDGYDLQPETPNYKTQYGFDNVHIRQKLKYTINQNIDISLLGAYYTHEQKKLIKSLKTHPINKDYTLNFSSNFYFNAKDKINFTVHTDQYEIHRKQHEHPFQSRLEYKNSILNPRLTADLKISENNNLNVGMEYMRDRLEGICVSGEANFTEYTNNGNQDYVTDNQYFLFAQDEWNLNSNFTLTLGARAEYYELHKFQFLPTASVKYDYNKFIFRLNIGKAYKAPALKELFMDYVVPGMGDIHIVGNPKLKPETSTYYSFSSEYYYKCNRFSIILYNNHLKNMIRSFIDPEDTSQMLYRNESKVNSKGIDVLFNSKPFKFLSLGGGYSFNYSKNEETNQQLDNNSKHSIRGNLAYNFNWEKFKLRSTFHLMCKWFGSKTNYNPHHKDFYKKPDYAIWTTSLVTHINKQYKLALGLDNIFDYVGIDYSTTNHPGRKAFVSFVYNFKI